MAKAAGLDSVKPGDSISVPVDLLLVHDGTAGALMDALPDDFTPGLKKEQVIVTLDHAIPAPTQDARKLHRRIKTFCREHQLTLYGNGEGIMHQVVAELHTPKPGHIVVGADGHVLTSTAFDAICFSENGTKAAEVLRKGEYNLTVPETLTVSFTGKIPAGVTSRDLAFLLLREFGLQKLKGKFLQLNAPEIYKLSISEKMAFCNVFGELGIMSACFIGDTCCSKENNIRYVSMDIEGPLAAAPDDPSNICSVESLSDIKPSMVVIGGCSNGRIEDMAVVAGVLSGEKIHPDIDLIILPASRNVANAMSKAGYSEAIRTAGGIIAPPGCGSCGGNHQGIAWADDIIATTTVRNTPGRMGEKNAKIYLVSPETAAQTAIWGCITNKN